jgi:prepilin-type N-terminal cleavage/methylation domain-containing protein
MRYLTSKLQNLSLVMIIPRSTSSVRVVGKRGFTLVELLVVIGIISILISVLAPAAWNALKIARESAATQSSHGIGGLMAQYALDHGQYPDAATSTDAFKLLLAGGYLTSADIFYLPNGHQTKFKGTAPAVNMTSVNVSWDIIGVDGTGSSSGPVGITVNAPSELPIVFSTGGTVNIPQQAGAGTATCTGAGPLGVDGLAVTYKDNSSAFMKTDSSTGSYMIPNFIEGSFDPLGQTYVQRKP